FKSGSFSIPLSNVYLVFLSRGLSNYQKLSEIIKTARGTMSQRAFGKLLGVSATAVQLWERGDTVPDTENLAKLAARAGYSLEELLRFLDGKPLSDPLDIQDIVNKIRFLPLSQVALIGKAVAERFAASAEAAGE
ncbi:helix-turn-helix transcriptional regulator, partial [Microcoleus sp. B3-A4]|uniref:helix-turn-helix transcriptional regulator n=1 Tax=Microcoleus sp. B3-A4 TaxID=2818653 RepID=UPI002FCFCBB4